MANRYANLVGSKKISEDWSNINVGFDRVQAEMDTKGTPADAQAKADAAKAAAIAEAAAALSAHKQRGADEHPVAKGNAAGFMSAADKLKMDASTSDPIASTLMQRDAEGRAKVAAPVAAEDIARKAEVDTVQANLDSHAADADIHVTAEDHTKLNNIQEGAEVNQNAFAQVNNVVASDPSDTVTFVGGTGITVTTDPASKKVTVTATGEATPGPHASSHITGGTDVIPDAVTGGSSGLMSGADAKFVRQDGESKTGAQAKADAALVAAKTYADGKAAEVSAEVDQAIVEAKAYTDNQVGDLANLQTTDKDNLVDALNEVFTSGVNGKEQVSSAIIAKGGTVAGTSPHSFQELVEGIDTIETATVINGQIEQMVVYTGAINANDPIYTRLQIITGPNLPPGPTSTGRAVAFSSDGKYMAVGYNSGSAITIYKIENGNFTTLPAPDVLPKDFASGVAFSPDGLYLAVAHDVAPYITIYKRNGDVFTKLPNPSILLTGAGMAIAFSPDGVYLAIGHDTTPFITIYKRNGDVFTKLPNPSTLPTGSVLGVAFSPDGSYLVAGHSVSPYMTVYNRQGDSFIKMADPADLPFSAVRRVAFAPSYPGGYKFAVIHNSPGLAIPLTIYRIQNSILSMLTRPTGFPTSPTGRSVAFSPDGLYLAAGIYEEPYVLVFESSGVASYTRTTIPTLTTGIAIDLAFDPESNLLAIAGANSPFITLLRAAKMAYKSPNTFQNISTVAKGLGYALESGSADEDHKAIIIWR